jgi:hypothetical protein
MGAVGPYHFMAVQNGAVAVYDKTTGHQVTPATSLGSFFAVSVPSGTYKGTYPTGFAVDPRVVYDQASQRWIATALDTGSQQVLLAVSYGSTPGGGDPSWVPYYWAKYLVPVAQPGSETDFTRLGVDGNGIYITCALVGQTTLLAALPKGPFLNGSAQTVQSMFIFDIGVPYALYVYPAVNFDPVSTADPVWFIGEYSGSLYYNKLQWVNGLGSQPQFQLSSWGTLTISPSYEDLGLFSTSLLAPQRPSTGKKVWMRTGSELMMATVRKLGGTQFLWTCHMVGVNSAGNDDGLNADRMGVEWFQIQTAPTFLITAQGRVFDASAAPNQRFYYLPSLGVNTNSDMVLGFSGSSVSDYIGAFYTRRSANGAMMSAPVPYQPGTTYADLPGNVTGWGDYSYSSLDPDGLKIWTIQECANGDSWNTQVGCIRTFGGGP